MNHMPNERADITGLSVTSLMDMRAELTPAKPFLINPETGEEISYSDCLERMQAIAGLVRSHGLKPGDTVGYAMSNSTDAALVILGIMYGGFLATAINLVAGKDTISYVLDHSQTRLVFADQQGAGILSAVEMDDQVIVLDPSDMTPVSGRENAESAEPVEAGTDGLLMYTSGTTGRPKGVMLSHQSLLAGGKNAAEAHQLSGNDRAMCVLPLYHINGLCVTIMGPLVSGGSVVIPGRFSVSTFWQTIAAQACSWFSVVPTQISYLLHDMENGKPVAAGCKHLRFGRSASAPLSPDVHEAFENAFGIPVIETMGLTETAAQILSNPMPPGTRKIGSPGIAYGNEVMIADTAQREMIRGTEGEVLVRGPNVMRGYLNNPDATAEALTSDGWLRTGDLGRMDEQGYVYITGRLKELIIKGGENIAPREIDDALYSHSDVVEAAAFACPCRNYGQRIEAGVALREGSSVTEQQLLDLCIDKLGKFKAPDHIHFLPELPKGPSGKIQRIKLAEILDNN